MGKQPRYVFTEEDDQKLRSLIEQVGLKWHIIAEEMKLKPRQCRDRWTYYLKPGVEDKPWEPEEDEYLKSEVEQFGTRWAYIGEKMGRTDIQVKNRFNLLRRKEAKKMSQKIPPPMIKRSRPKKDEVKKDDNDDSLPLPQYYQKLKRKQKNLPQADISPSFDLSDDDDAPRARKYATNVPKDVPKDYLYISPEYRDDEVTRRLLELQQQRRVNQNQQRRVNLIGQKVPINLIQFPPFDDDDDDDDRSLTPPPPQFRPQYPIPQFNRPQYNQPQYKTQPTSPVSQSSFHPVYSKQPKEKNIHNTFLPYVPQDNYEPTELDLMYGEYDPFYYQ